MPYPGNQDMLAFNTLDLTITQLGPPSGSPGSPGLLLFGVWSVYLTTMSEYDNTYFLDAGTIARYLGTTPSDIIRRAILDEIPSHWIASRGEHMFLLDEVLSCVRVSPEFFRTQRVKVALDPFAKPGDRLKAIEALEKAYLGGVDREPGIC